MRVRGYVVRTRGGGHDYYSFTSMSEWDDQEGTEDMEEEAVTLEVPDGSGFGEAFVGNAMLVYPPGEKNGLTLHQAILDGVAKIVQDRGR